MVCVVWQLCQWEEILWYISASLHCGLFQLLGDEQWAWLENELNRDSAIKVIGSSITILPLLYSIGRVWICSSYCSYFGPKSTFDKANFAVDEGPSMDGPSYDIIWAEIPKKRMRLLHLC